jgi:two-component system, sensor histidine kinase and response regulator
MAVLKLMVVDDEPGIRSGVNRILSRYTVSYPFMDEDFSFDVAEVATGEEALEQIQKDLPDVILLDNKLPGIQGVEILERIRNKKLDVVVAMITSYASLDVAIQATRDGATDFIPKPFTPQELKASIDNITKQLYLKRITSSLQREGRQIRYQFLSVLSHELKAPLNAIEGYLRMMQEKQLGNQLDDYLPHIDRSLQRIQGMRTLIMDLLDFTKIRFERKREKMQWLDLAQVAEMSAGTVRPYAIQMDVQVELDIEENARVFADPEDMEIVLNNLFSNAVKYNKQGGDVLCAVYKKDRHTVLEVKDTGIGMSRSEVDALFQEFSRIKNEKTRNISGSGLGLSIVRKIVDLYKGDITVESTPDEGSVFRVFLPENIEENSGS